MELQPAVMQEPSVYYYFRPYVREALTDVAPQAGEDTEFYLVHLLGDYARSQRLFDGMGRSAPPLAIQLTSALQAPNPAERVGLLKRLGDYTLYMTGFFAGGLNTRLVDINYYVQLGAAAYERLAAERTPGEIDLSVLFRELATGFDRFVEVLRQVRDRSLRPSEQEVMALYQAWLSRGCEVSARRLTRLGHPLPRRGRVD